MKARLKKKLLEEFALRGTPATTRATYSGCIERYERHFDASAAQLGAQHVRAFLLHLARDRGLSSLTQNVYSAALRFLYCDVLRRPRVVAQMPRRKVARRTVEVLTAPEVRRLLDALVSRAHRMVCAEPWRRAADPRGARAARPDGHCIARTRRRGTRRTRRHRRQSSTAAARASPAPPPLHVFASQLL